MDARILFAEYLQELGLPYQRRSVRVGDWHAFC